MLCPTCEVDLTITDRQGVEIDVCPRVGASGSIAASSTRSWSGPAPRHPDRRLAATAPRHAPGVGAMMTTTTMTTTTMTIVALDSRAPHVARSLGSAISSTSTDDRGARGGIPALAPIVEASAMDQILELLKQLETLAAAWDGPLRAIRDLVYGSLPPELGDWLSANEWLLWGVVVTAALILVATLVGNLIGGE